MMNTWDLPLWISLVFSLAVLIACSEVGHFFGLRSKQRANFSVMQSSVLGLLAFMVSFTFAMGLTRLDARRDALTEEANGIGTAALRSRLLPQPFAAESL